MVRKILIVTATETEASVFRDIETPKGSGNSSLFEGTRIDILVTGIGTMACSRSLLNHFNKSGHPDLAINAGIAGSFNLAHGVGSVSIVSRDSMADFGIDDKGKFIPAGDAGFVLEDANPFAPGGWIECNNIYTKKLAGMFHFCTGITSDTVSGSAERINMLKNRYNPDIESMEGASFFYICALEKVPFIAIRAVSNMVEERQRSSWRIPLAMKGLEEMTKGIIKMLNGE